MKLEVNLNEEQFGELSDDLKENYTKQKTDDGTTYVLTIEGMTHEDVGGLKSALDKQKEGRLKAEKAADKARQEADELRTKMESNPSYKDRYQTAKRQSLVSDAAVKHNGNSELLQPILKDSIRIEENDGVEQVTVLDRDGQVMLDDEGMPLSVDARIEQMRKDDQYAGLFKGTGSSGGGAPPSSHSVHSMGGGTPPFRGGSTQRRSQMTTEEKATYAREHGTDGLMKLPL